MINCSVFDFVLKHCCILFQKKKITVVVEDTNNDDAQDGNLPSTGQKKVSVMTEVSLLQ